MDFKEALRTDILRSIGTKPPIIVEPDATVANSLSLLKRYKKGCVLVVDQDKLVGICTERDLMKKIVDPHRLYSTRISEIMTPNPQTLTITDSIEKIIQLMHKGGYRHVPIVEQGKLIGYISVIDIIDYLAENFPHGIFNLPPIFRQVNTSQEGA